MRVAPLLLLVVGGCPHAPQPARPAGRGHTVDPAIVEALTLPPGPAAAGALARLERETSCAAVGLRVRYLVDLFDHSRLSPVELEGPAPAHALLWRALSLPGAPGRGRLATGMVLDRLQQLASTAAPRCGEVADARRLLELDRRSRRGAELSVAESYRRMARSGSPFAPNAQLRLCDWCSKAFRLAAGGLPSQQHERIAQCLYPLVDGDPGPYFSPNPAERPTDPPWTLLARHLTVAWRSLTKTRLAALAGELERADQELFRQAAPLLPTPIDLDRERIPLSAAGEPWDRTPLVRVSERGFVVGGRAILADDTEPLPAAIAARLRNDLRRRVGVVASSGVRLGALVVLARAAARAGAATLELGVARVIEPAPASPGAPVRRLEVIPVSLRLFAASAVAGGRDLPQRVEYSAGGAENQLVVGLERDRVWLASRDGTLQVAKGQLREALVQLSRAYPDDTSLVLAAAAQASFGQLVEVAALARPRVGRPLFPGLALSTPGREAPPDQDLRPMLERLAAARVRIEPDDVAAPGLRACYRESLRASKQDAAPEGTLLLEVRAGRGRAAGGTLRDRSLRRCAGAALAGEARRLTVHFSAR